MKIKRYILFVYNNYYPGGGWNDYKDGFNEISEAKKVIQCDVKGRNTGGNLIPVYIYNKSKYDNYELIDLQAGNHINLFNLPIQSYIK